MAIDSSNSAVASNAESVIVTDAHLGALNNVFTESKL